MQEKLGKEALFDFVVILKTCDSEFSHFVITMDCFHFPGNIPQVSGSVYSFDAFLKHYVGI